MKIILLFALSFIFWLNQGFIATAAEFTTAVSIDFHIADVIDLNLTNSQMDTNWFTNQQGGRTVYSSDETVGSLTNGTPDIQAHATWVINYDTATRTVNLNQGRTHITNWFGEQRCNIYEDNSCNCHNNPNWDICSYPPMETYVKGLQLLAKTASMNAQIALEREGFTVTRN